MYITENISLVQIKCQNNFGLHLFDLAIKVTRFILDFISLMYVNGPHIQRSMPVIVIMVN